MRIEEDSFSSSPDSGEIYKVALSLAENYEKGSYTSLTAVLAVLRFYYEQGGGALKVFSGGGILGGGIVAAVSKALG